MERGGNTGVGLLEGPWEGPMVEQLRKKGRTQVGQLQGGLSAMGGTQHRSGRRVWGIFLWRRKEWQKLMMNWWLQLWWTDCNPYFPSPCTTGTEQIEKSGLTGGRWSKICLLFFITLMLIGDKIKLISQRQVCVACDRHWWGLSPCA